MKLASQTQQQIAPRHSKDVVLWLKHVKVLRKNLNGLQIDWGDIFVSSVLEKTHYY